MSKSHTPIDAFGPGALLTGRLLEAGREAVYAVDGDLDRSTADPLETRLAALARGTVGDLALDLSGVELLDSVGLRVLMRTHRLLDADGRRLVLRDPSERVLRVLHLTLLDRWFTLRATPGLAGVGSAD